MNAVGVNNSVYTNVVAAMALQFAIEVALIEPIAYLCRRDKLWVFKHLQSGRQLPPI